MSTLLLPLIALLLLLPPSPDDGVFGSNSNWCACSTRGITKERNQVQKGGQLGPRSLLTLAISARCAADSRK